MTARSPGRTTAHAPDKPFLVITALLLFTGLAILSMASVALSYRDFGNGFSYVTRQMLYGGALGLLLAGFAQLVPIRWFRHAALIAFVVTIILLLVVFIPGIGLGAKGAVRWIGLGPITVQPGEIARVTLPWYLAAWFVAKRAKQKNAHDTEESQNLLTPFLMIVALIGLPLLLQPDLSTVGVLTITAVVMYFLAGGSLRQITTLIGGGMLLLLLLIRLEPYRMNRIFAFLHPERDPLGVGYQVNQALLAVGSGGLFGRGIGFSREKLFFLPEPMGDSIFAVFAEEAGFIGATLLITLFLAFLWRGFMIIRRLNDPFLRLFAGGLVTWIVLQALLNIAGNVALAPLVGITLPFVSYGNASLAMTILSAGIIYRFSKYTVSNSE